MLSVVIVSKVTNINLNVLKYLGMTSLHFASRNGHQSVVELILDRGANIDQKNNYGEFILSIHIYVLIKQLFAFIIFDDLYIYMLSIYDKIATWFAGKCLGRR